MRLCLHLLLVVLPQLVFAVGGSILQTAADVSRYKDSGDKSARQFLISGLVTYKYGHFSHETNEAVVVQDDTGFVSMRCPLAICPSAETIIKVCGHTFVDRNGWIQLQVETLSQIGSGSIPPPVDASFEQILRGETDHRIVRTSCFVIDARKDEADSRFFVLTLKSGDKYLTASIAASATTEKDLRSLVNAQVRLTGHCITEGCGVRAISRARLYLSRMEDIVVTVPPPHDVFAVPPLGEMRYQTPEFVRSVGLRSVVGQIVVTWQSQHMMVRTATGKDIVVNLAQISDLPPAGTWIKAIGFPDTDLYSISLSLAKIRPESSPGDFPDEAPTEIGLRDLFESKNGANTINAEFHCKTIRLRGVVRGVQQGNGRFFLEQGRHLLSVDTSACPEIAQQLADDCLVSLTGVCLLETGKQTPSQAFPRAHGFFVVPRSSDDVLIISRPPWLNTQRFLWIIFAIFALLLGVLVWNRILNKLIERRSRELLKEQIAHSSSILRIDERTRLAVELHDSLSQNLAAVAFQLSSAKSAKQCSNMPAEEKHIATAEKMLDSCRTELRYCLSDLRSDMIEEPDFTKAILKTLKSITPTTSVSTRISIPRSKISDSTTHSILMIIRELVSNAVRHGKATAVEIAGSLQDRTLVLSVRDNGTGFDTTRYPGEAEGHFGLAGIRHRVKGLLGNLTLESTSGQGTHAFIRLELPPQANIT